MELQMLSDPGMMKKKKSLRSIEQNILHQTPMMSTPQLTNTVQSDIIFQ
jgi:hypothetical protein